MTIPGHTLMSCAVAGILNAGAETGSRAGTWTGTGTAADEVGRSHQRRNGCEHKDSRDRPREHEV